ncbi:aminoglycoside phosphotransferase family protein [Micromonospora sp. NPDC049004]|uniref:aminoglycoside phosphotransferase family protein n=1 Tax=Micromonospora sp. NPDC049004 TaxID=3154348 RepID=UPI0033E843E2
MPGPTDGATEQPPTSGNADQPPTGGHADQPPTGGDVEEALTGGYVADVVRIGDTVRRTPPANLDFVGALLRHLAEVGADLAPRHLGVDDRGRQVLSYVAGRVPWRDREDPGFFADAALVRLAELIRRLHDACAGTDLAGDAETVCHRDLSPKNTVYRDSPTGPLPVAFIDWDLARPGRRIEDVAFAGWHWAPLGEGADPAELGRRCRVLCAAYDAAGPGLLPRAELVDVMLDQIGSTWRGIDADADRDVPAMRRLRDAGAVAVIRRWQDWLHTHRHTVATPLSP